MVLGAGLTPFGFSAFTGSFAESFLPISGLAMTAFFFSAAALALVSSSFFFFSYFALVSGFLGCSFFFPFPSSNFTFFIEAALVGSADFFSSSDSIASFY